CSYPDVATSRALAWKNLLFIRHSPTFGGMTGLLYLLVGWNILGSLRGFQIGGFGATLEETLLAALSSASAFTTIVVALLGFFIFTDTHKTWYRFAGGLAHACAHLGAAIAIGWLMSQVAIALAWPFGGLRHLAATLIALFLGGWIFGALIMGCYLLISINLFGRHYNEAFSGLCLQDYKQFLRIVVGPDGDLTIYPIGIDRVPRRWREVPDAPRDQARFVPADDDAQSRPRLIEAPIVVKASA
ncbi:MAG TPA: hypothetical protein VGB85_11040, partial [Nannocystis sp.]